MDPALAVDGASAVKTDDHLIRRRFYNTSSDADAALAIEKLCAEPIPPMTQPVRVTPERFGRVKRAFIQTRFDNAVPMDAQAAMCAALPCDPVIVMDTDHSPFLSAPQEFAAISTRWRVRVLSVRIESSKKIVIARFMRATQFGSEKNGLPGQAGQ